MVNRWSDFNSSLFTKSLHTWLGLASGVFLTILLLTGVMLNHPSTWIAGAGGEILSLAADPSNSQRVYRGTRAALERSDDGGKTWEEVPMLYPAQEVVGIAFDPRAPARVLALQRWMGILESTDGGAVWDSVPLDFDPQAADVELRSLSVSAGGELYLETSAGLLRRAADGKWSSVDFDPQRKNWSRIVREIHNGRFFGPWFVKVYDIVAGALLILLVTGIVLWRMKKF